MRGSGTLVNVLAVIAGGLLGLLLKRGIQKRYEDILMQAMGVCVLFVGMAGALSGMLRLGEDGSLTTEGSLLLIVSMALGSLIGEFLNLTGWLERFGTWLKERARGQDDSGFVEGFVNTSLCICVGAMAVVGALEDGLTGDASMLYTKALLDGLIVTGFASTYGKGAVFSAIPIALLQGSITVCAVFLAPVLGNERIIETLSFVGSVLIFCVGANLGLGQKFKVANMLPALVVAGVLAAVL